MDNMASGASEENKFATSLETSYEAFTVSKDKEELLDEHDKHRVDLHLAVKLRIAAIAVSWTSTIVALVQGVFALVISFRDDSEALFGFALDAILDSISSMIVLWRFYGTKETVYSDRREKIACAIIGVLFIACGLSLVGKAAFSLVKGSREETTQLLIILCITNGILSLILGVTKIVVGYKLESKSLQADSIITLIGSGMSFITLAGAKTLQYNPEMWRMDSICGIVFGVFLFIYGFMLVWRYVIRERIF